MTEYISLVIVILGVMIYLLHLAFSLSDEYDPLKILIIGISMVFGILLIHLGKSISVDQGASVAIQNAMDIGYYVWITITSIVFIYISIYIIPQVWKKMNVKEKKKDMYEEEKE